MLHPEEWVKHKHICVERSTIEKLKSMPRFDEIGSSRLRVKEDPYWEFIPVDHYISFILHNQITLLNNVLYNVSDYGNDKIEYIYIYIYIYT